MIKLDKAYIRCLVKKAPQRKNVSYWYRGVKNYAECLLDNLPDDYCMILANNQDLEEHLKIFTKLLLNGANNWKQYSYGGNAFIYNEEIAVALCNPSEYRKTKRGEKQPNSYETWLDVQARALYQAERLITSVIRDNLLMNKQ